MSPPGDSRIMIRIKTRTRDRLRLDPVHLQAPPLEEVPTKRHLAKPPDIEFGQIDCDCKFLESERIMDYSLLLGLHFRAPQFPAIFSSEPSCQADQVSDRGKDEPVTQAAQTTPSNGLVLVAHKPQKSVLPPGSHVRGSPLRAPAAGNEEVDLLLPGTARLRVQLGVNMPARADRRPWRTGEFGETYDVVLYLGIIDILQEYDVGKRLEHAYKSLQFDSLSFSAVDPALYSRRFQDFIRKTFPDSWD
ncbi:hypothetical protein L7F22_036147 [Adiantum nelumboides]|nr:hypothetical protein [Adiantum nelumboides]